MEVNPTTEDNCDRILDIACDVEPFPALLSLLSLINHLMFKSICEGIGIAAGQALLEQPSLIKPL